MLIELPPIYPTSRYFLFSRISFPISGFSAFKVKWLFSFTSFLLLKASFQDLDNFHQADYSDFFQCSVCVLKFSSTYCKFIAFNLIPLTNLTASLLYSSLITAFMSTSITKPILRITLELIPWFPSQAFKGLYSFRF